MKILWIGPNLLHPTTKGGQIRTLETLRQLRLRHEIDYLCFGDSSQQTAIALGQEYAARLHVIPHERAANTLSLALELLAGLWQPVPLAVSRWHSDALSSFAKKLAVANSYDLIVCDFLAMAENICDWPRTVLFQHNVESNIWSRHRDHAPTPIHRWYFGLQASKMQRYEAKICSLAHHVIAVSEQDASSFQHDLGISHVSSVPTGVDLDYFCQPQPNPTLSRDLVFVGSMDWRPNLDGMGWFLSQIMPLIRQSRPDTSLTIVGRQPPASLIAQAKACGNVEVTGTVDDVRPYLWQARASIVPLRIGGGTRLKIYESMAAQVPVVSTTVGAEGLYLAPELHYLCADGEVSFAAQCVRLLDDEPQREKLAANAFDFVSSKYGWPSVARRFEQVLIEAAARITK